MYETYSRIFTRIGLDFRAVAADTGAMGGSSSHEFHVLADSGEDAIAFCPHSDYAANVELATSLPGNSMPSEAPTGAKNKISTPGIKTCQEVAEFLGIPIQKTVKALAITADEQFFIVAARGSSAQ